MMDTMRELDEQAWGPLTAQYIWKLEADSAILRAQRDELATACRAFVQAWEKSHQLEETDIAYKMAVDALATTAVGTKGR